MVLKAKYRHYVEVHTATRTSDGQGGYTSAWAKASDEWMRAVRVSESRTLDNGGIKYTHACEFYANKYSGNTITEANRLVWDSINWTIHSIIPSDKLDEVKIIAYG